LYRAYLEISLSISRNAYRDKTAYIQISLKSLAGSTLGGDDDDAVPIFCVLGINESDFEQSV